MGSLMKAWRRSPVRSSHQFALLYVLMSVTIGGALTAFAGGIGGIGGVTGAGYAGRLLMLFPFVLAVLVGVAKTTTV